MTLPFEGLYTGRNESIGSPPIAANQHLDTILYWEFGLGRDHRGVSVDGISNDILTSTARCK